MANIELKTKILNDKYTEYVYEAFDIQNREETSVSIPMNLGEAKNFDWNIKCSFDRCIKNFDFNLMSSFFQIYFFQSPVFWGWCRADAWKIKVGSIIWKIAKSHTRRFNRGGSKFIFTTTESAEVRKTRLRRQNWFWHRQLLCRYSWDESL